MLNRPLLDPPHHEQPPPQPRQRDATALFVTKTLQSGQAGTRRHMHVYGSRLICVRHRIDPVQRCRLVTVELVVEVRPITPRDDPEVAVRIDPNAKPLRARLLACGGRWDAAHKVWRMPQSVARSLRLTRQVLVSAAD